MTKNTLFARNRNNNINLKMLLVLPFLLYLTLSIGCSLTKIPWCDEAWFAGSAVNLVRSGFLGNTNAIFIGTPWSTLNEYTYWQPPIYFLMEALIFKLFGIGLIQVRLISVFWGLLGLIAVYYFVNKLFENDLKLTFLSLLLVGTFNYYIIGSADGRMDMMAASLSLIGLTFFVVLRERNFSLSVFLGNTFICLSGLTHPNGILGFIALLFLILCLDRNKIKLNTLVLSVIPYVLGAFGWGIYILQDIEAFKAQFFTNVMRPGDENYVFGISWGKIYSEIVQRWLYPFGLSPQTRAKLGLLSYSGIPVLLMFFAGLILAPFMLKEKRNKLIWCILCLYFLGLTLLIANKTPCYLVWIVPLFLLNLVGLYAVIVRKENWQFQGKLKLNFQRVLHMIFILAFAYMVLYSVTSIIKLYIIQDRYHNCYLRDLQEFSERYYKGGKIYGSEVAFFYNFNDNIAQDDWRLGYYTGIKPDYFVVDEEYESRIEKCQKKNPLLYNYITKTLSTEYKVVFKGKIYTFYEWNK